jgi:hypothetical protein
VILFGRHKENECEAFDHQLLRIFFVLLVAEGPGAVSGLLSGPLRHRAAPVQGRIKP